MNELSVKFTGEYNCLTYTNGISFWVANCEGDKIRVIAIDPVDNHYCRTILVKFKADEIESVLTLRKEIDFLNNIPLAPVESQIAISAARIKAIADYIITPILSRQSGGAA